MIAREQLTAPEFYKTYLNAVDENDPVKSLKNNSRRFAKLLKRIPKNKRDYAYAEGKWTLRQLFQHLIDTERVFALRSLWFARKDVSALPGFDENSWAQYSRAEKRRWKDLAKEFNAVRNATIMLFESFNKEQLMMTGISNNNLVSVAAFGYIAAGHVEHHIKVIKTRYLGKNTEKNKKQPGNQDNTIKRTPVSGHFPGPDNN